MALSQNELPMADRHVQCQLLLTMYYVGGNDDGTVLSSAILGNVVFLLKTNVNTGRKHTWILRKSHIRSAYGLFRTVNTLRPRQDGRHFPDDIFKCIFSNENVSISIKISVKFVPKSQINNIQALVHIMACRRPGDKPLSEPMKVILLTHICVTRPQWGKLYVFISWDVIAIVV